MLKFTSVKSYPAIIDLVNIDTDMIIPKQFLKTIERSGLGKYLFYEMRYDEDGGEIDNFILNQNKYRNSEILIVGDNFGCGSSREHAPWALLDFGIRCIIAPSFADIFYNNCFKNGILLIQLPSEKVKDLMTKKDYIMEVNLLDQKIKILEDKQVNEVLFTIDDDKKQRLINGLDDISISLSYEDEINRFIDGKKQRNPWLFA